MIENPILPKLKPRYKSISSLLNGDSVSPEKLLIEIKRLKPRILDLKEQSVELSKKIPPDLLSSFNEIQEQIDYMTKPGGFDNEKKLISLKLFNFKGKFLSKINTKKQDIALHTEMLLQNILEQTNSKNPFMKKDENYKYEKLLENIERQIKIIENRASTKLNDIELLLSQKKSLKPGTNNSKTNQIGRYLHSLHKIRTNIFTYNGKLEFIEKEWQEIQPTLNLFNYDDGNNDTNSIFDIVKKIPKLDEKLEDSTQLIQQQMREYMKEVRNTEKIIDETEKHIEEKENEVSALKNRLNELNEFSLNLQQRANEILEIVRKSSKTYTPEDQKQDIQHIYMLYAGNNQLLMDELKFIENNFDQDFNSYIKYRV